MKKYVWNVLVSVDQFFNTLLGGDPDETISSRMGKRARKGDKLGKIVCKILNFFQEGHCQKSIEEDEGKDETFKL
jgi:hypothetical protein